MAASSARPIRERASTDDAPIGSRHHRAPPTGDQPEIGGAGPGEPRLGDGDAGKERLLLLAATHQGRHAIRPLDGPTADLADRQLGVVVTKRAADEVIGEQVGVTVPPAPARDESVDRAKVAA